MSLEAEAWKMQDPGEGAPAAATKAGPASLVALVLLVLAFVGVSLVLDLVPFLIHGVVALLATATAFLFFRLRAARGRIAELEHLLAAARSPAPPAD